ncbi:hypothetical protein HID58_051240 [Brassica napus]|uniref:Uncharacterized protein n=1 Tax=Brassica napus TaxID=3708 RepID=A0ABQ8A8G7_BRANA|nr:uncharacterized protein LOC106386029 [Brassica napus]KAH0888811.1 hypothetical protein HID58_051240 [Brassica napus]
MEGGRRTPLSVRKKPKRTNRRLVRNVVAYLKSDAYLFAPLFSKFSPLPPQIQMPPPSLKAEVAVKKNKKRLSEKVKEYLNSDCHMYRPMISLPKPGSALKGTLQITNLVTMEVSARSATVREDNNNYRNIMSDIAEHAMHNGRISVPKPALVILEGQRI